MASSGHPRRSHIEGEHADLGIDWVGWARDYADQLDPLGDSPTMPAPPDPTPEALEQHLPPGWSAHGPEHGRERRPRRLGAA